MDTSNGRIPGLRMGSVLPPLAQREVLRLRSLSGAGLDQVAHAGLHGAPGYGLQMVSEFAGAGARQINVMLFSAGPARRHRADFQQVPTQISSAPATSP